MCNSGNKEARGRFFTEKLILKGVPHALKKATDFRRNTNKGYILFCSFTRRFLQRNHRPLSTGNNSGISKQEGFLSLVLQVTQVRDRATHTDTTVFPGEVRSGQLGNDSEDRARAKHVCGSEFRHPEGKENQDVAVHVRRDRRSKENPPNLRS